MSRKSRNNRSERSTNARRRTVLKLSGAGILPIKTGSLKNIIGQEEVSVRRDDVTGDGTQDIVLENSNIYVQMNGDDVDSRYFAVHGGPRGGTDLTGPLETRPAIPEKTSLQHEVTNSFDVVEDTGQLGSYRVDREYTLGDTPLRIAAEVQLHAGDSFFLVTLTYENLGRSPIELDHINSHIHDGMHLIEGLDLRGRSDSTDDYRVYLPGTGARYFKDISKWTTFPGSSWGTLFDNTDALTFGLVDGESEPRMWIEEDGTIDFLTKELTIDPGETISYTVCFGIHKGGNSAETVGKELYSKAQLRVQGEPVSFSGNVTSIDGEPVSDVNVTIYDKQTSADGPHPVELARGTTDSVGQFDVRLWPQDRMKLVAEEERGDSRWFAVRELRSSAVEHTQEIQLRNQLLYGPAIASTPDGNRVGTVTFWRSIDPRQPTNQVLYVEIAETTGDDTHNPWEIDASRQLLKEGAFSVTLPEEFVVGYDGSEEIEVPVGVLNTSFTQRNRNRSNVAQWHPSRPPALPTFEVSSADHFDVLTRIEQNISNGGGKEADSETDSGWSALLSILGLIPRVGILFSFLGLLISLPSDDGRSGSGNDEIGSFELAHPVPHPDFNEQDIVSNSWSLGSMLDSDRPSALTFQIPVRFDSDIQDPITCIAETVWKTEKNRSARFSKGFSLGLDTVSPIDDVPHPDLPNTLMVDGTDMPSTDDKTRYVFETSGLIVRSSDSGSVEPRDMVKGHLVSGSVNGDVDSYEFSGRPLAAKLDGPHKDDVTISINGEETQPGAVGSAYPSNSLDIVGDGTFSAYQFTVSNTVSGISTDPGDVVSGSEVRGSVSSETDRYQFSGEITEFYAGNSVSVFLNDVRVNPEDLSNARIIGERGSISVDQPDDSWHTVTLNDSYRSPVVAATLSANGPPPSHVRIRNVGSDSFEFQIEEWEYLDGKHTTETIHYLVVEEGLHTLPDGTSLEAGTVLVDHQFTGTSFETDFPATPVVLAQAQTDNGYQAIVTRQRNATNHGIEVRLQEEESLGKHVNEVVGFIAIEPSAGTNGGAAYESNLTEKMVGDEVVRVSFENSYDGDPVVVAALQSMVGTDPTGLRYRSIDETSMELFAEEEQSHDEETNHVPEIAAFVVFDSAGPIFAM